jgi:hypothetical protein
VPVPNTPVTTVTTSASEQVLALLDAARPAPGADWSPTSLAARVAADIVHQHPDLAQRWLNERLADWLREVLTRQEASLRSHTRQLTRKKEFADNVLQTWTIVIDDENTRRPIGKATARDLTFAAMALAQQAKTLKNTSNFYFELAKDLPPGTHVEDKYTEEAFQGLMQLFGV